MQKVFVLLYIQFVDLFSERCYVTGLQENTFVSNSNVLRCAGNTTITIVDLNVEQHTTSCSETNHCNLTEEKMNSIKRHCNKEITCTISKFIPNSCLVNDYGHVSISYSCTGHSTSSCTFENEDFSVNCGWYERGSVRYKWVLGHGETPTYYTGPDRDHTTASEDGYYAYTESLDDSAYNDESSLLSGLIVPSTKQCLKFWYHMYGRDINTLKVFQMNSEHNIELWNKSGSQGYKWHFQSLALTNIGPYQIMFKAIRGNGKRSDIAVDDIFIYNTVCNKGLLHYTESCRKTDESISLSGCSKYYLQLNDIKFKFDGELENCSAVYQDVKSSSRTLCNDINNADICTVNLSDVIRKDPSCFQSNSLLIEYKCEERVHVPNILSNDAQEINIPLDKGLVVGMVVAVVLLVCVAVLIICLVRRRDSFRKTNTNQTKKYETNNSAGNRTASLTSFTADTNNPNSQCITTQRNHISNIYDNTELRDDIIDSDCEYSNISKANSVINKEGITVAKYRDYQGDVPSYNRSLHRDEYDFANQTNETSFIKGPIHQTGSTKSNMVIEHRGTIFGGSECYKFAKPTCFNDEKHHMKTENNDVYCSSEEGTYDFAGSNRHKEADGNIYSHTVDDVYDSTTHKRNDDDQEDKYDHFIGEKTEEVYDTSIQK
ncbi:unnamed protein product [Mytilus coruscus]|uniref:MAM domain-containing protein n=1 Tax=Mytilus coruscus TaxID=42192 RepID=A0A6J8C1Z7_MYTCO|nr:unnamed protein product [Mytilus coruscus]